MVDFAGYLMPITYPNGIVSEYKEVRNSAGIFDVSHMGQIFIHGAKSKRFIQEIITNDIESISEGQALYTVMCNKDGGVIDDLILYELSKTRYLMIVNASNIEKDYDWLCENNDMGVSIINQSSIYSLIALQGPKTYSLARKVFPEIPKKLGFFNHVSFKSKYGNTLVSRTGYTGEHGYEIMIENDNALNLWNDLLELNIAPCGLASRDILRLEMCYCLYGNDLNDKTTPISANLGWVTKLEKENFLGKDALIKDTSTDMLVPFKLLDRGIPRKGYKIVCSEREVGYVSSGAHSPILSTGIGMGYINKNYIKSNEKIYIDIRGSLIQIELLKGPFIKKTSLLINE